MLQSQPLHASTFIPSLDDGTVDLAAARPLGTGSVAFHLDTTQYDDESVEAKVVLHLELAIHHQDAGAAARPLELQISVVVGDVVGAGRRIAELQVLV